MSNTTHPDQAFWQEHLDAAHLAVKELEPKVTAEAQAKLNQGATKNKWGAPVSLNTPSVILSPQEYYTLKGLLVDGIATVLAFHKNNHSKECNALVCELLNNLQGAVSVLGNECHPTQNTDAIKQLSEGDDLSELYLYVNSILSTFREMDSSQDLSSLDVLGLIQPIGLYVKNINHIVDGTR